MENNNVLMKDTDIVSVRNRSNGVVGYEIPELRVNRRFTKGEVKKISMEELRQLSFVPGGQVILNEYLAIEEKAAIEELIPNAQPEYSYTEADIKKILLTGSTDELLDTFDFGPAGVKDIIKSLAVELKLNDVEKRDIIKEKTGFDVTKALQIKKADEEEEETKSETKQRRVVSTETKTTTPSRRVVKK